MVTTTTMMFDKMLPSLLMEDTTQQSTKVGG